MQSASRRSVMSVKNDGKDGVNQRVRVLVPARAYVGTGA